MTDINDEHNYSEYVAFMANNKEIHDPFDLSAFKYISGPVSVAIVRFRGVLWIIFGDNHGFGNELLENNRKNIAIEALIYYLRARGFELFLEGGAAPLSHIGILTVLCKRFYVNIDARDKRSIVTYTNKMDKIVSQLDEFNSTKKMELLNSIKKNSWSPERVEEMIKNGVMKLGIKHNFSNYEILMRWIDKENTRRLIIYAQYYDEMMKSNPDDRYYPIKVDNYVHRLFQSWGILMESYALYKLLDDQHIRNSVVFVGNDHANAITTFASEELECKLLFSVDNDEYGDNQGRFVDLGDYRMNNAFG